ncbi:MAG TPA: hypothetical protein VN914_06725, partial [Polyangia bacterium]|nr:hypothetical protein [Polyangia bacterium]
MLAINGGGSPLANYKSHLIHLKSLLSILPSDRRKPDGVTVLSSDGPDPAPDVATREWETAGAGWQFVGTKLEDHLGPEVTSLESSEIPGVHLVPATRAALSIWSLTVGQNLQAGDTLLIYVTDHGTRGATPDANRIVLWGKGESLSVGDLRQVLATFPPGVRVVTLMSQCFSGAFADLQWPSDKDRSPSGDFCGFFASPANRPAFGCYPETRDKLRVGHSFAFFRALQASGGHFEEAHRMVAERDDTPDIPLRTSDVYLERLLERDAAHRKLRATANIDRLLVEAEAGPACCQRQRDSLERLYRRFGVLPRWRVSGLADHGVTMKRLAEELREALARIGPAHEELNRRRLDSLLDAQPRWRSIIDPPRVAALLPAARLQLKTELLTDLDRDRGTPLASEVNQAKELRESLMELAHRMDVRAGIVQRARILLQEIAGRHYL